VARREKTSTVSVLTRLTPTNANSAMNSSSSHALAALSPRSSFSIEKHSNSLKLLKLAWIQIKHTQIDFICPQATTLIGKAKWSWEPGTKPSWLTGSKISQKTGSGEAVLFGNLKTQLTVRSCVTTSMLAITKTSLLSRAKTRITCTWSCCAATTKSTTWRLKRVLPAPATTTHSGSNMMNVSPALICATSERTTLRWTKKPWVVCATSPRSRPAGWWS